MKKQYCCSNFLFQEYNETSWIVFYFNGTSIGDAVRRCSGGWLFSCNDVISGPPFWAVPIRNVICYLADLLDKKNKCLVSHGSFQYCPRLGWLKKSVQIYSASIVWVVWSSITQGLLEHCQAQFQFKSNQV